MKFLPSFLLVAIVATQGLAGTFQDTPAPAVPEGAPTAPNAANEFDALMIPVYLEAIRANLAGTETVPVVAPVQKPIQRPAQKAVQKPIQKAVQHAKSVEFVEAHPVQLVGCFRGGILARMGDRIRARRAARQAYRARACGGYSSRAVFIQRGCASGACGS